MNLYEKLPVEFLIRFYNEVMNWIENGVHTKKLYYELGIIISVANRRGISLVRPSDSNQVVNQQALNDLLQSDQETGGPHIA